MGIRAKEEKKHSIDFTEIFECFPSAVVWRAARRKNGSYKRSSLRKENSHFDPTQICSGTASSC